MHTASQEAVLRLLEAAKRNIADAHISAVSGENRFDAAYKCIMQCAMVALWVNGYRTSTSQPGHHQTAIQTLPTTIGLPQSTVIILDSLRKQRNVSDYEGDPISDQAVIECIKQAEHLHQYVLDWIKNHRTDLV
ncbi:MAG: hypothetical protein Q7T58_04785 [Methylotenera sp.]|nr:hypothetical protein [Methylotenera sp.]